MKKVSLFILLICWWTAAFSQCDNRNFTTIDGEVATYSIYYNWHFIWMNAGEVTFSNSRTRINGHDAYQLKAVGKTYSKYDFFYSVRDTFASIVDTLDLTPYTFKQRCKEGGLETQNDYNYDTATKKITGHSKTTKGKEVTDKRFSMPWPECSFDVMTMVYKARNIDFANKKVGETIPFSMLINAESYDLFIRYLGKDKIVTRGGESFNCVKFSVLLVDGTIFSAGEDMTVWVTDDQNRVPVYVEAKILIGYIKAFISKHKGLRHK